VASATRIAAMADPEPEERRPESPSTPRIAEHHPEVRQRDEHGAQHEGAGKGPLRVLHLPRERREIRPAVVGPHRSDQRREKAHHAAFGTDRHARHQRHGRGRIEGREEPDEAEGDHARVLERGDRGLLRRTQLGPEERRAEHQHQHRERERLLGALGPAEERAERAARQETEAPHRARCEERYLGPAEDEAGVRAVGLPQRLVEPPGPGEAHREFGHRERATQRDHRAHHPDERRELEAPGLAHHGRRPLEDPRPDGGVDHDGRGRDPAELSPQQRFLGAVSRHAGLSVAGLAGHGFARARGSRSAAWHLGAGRSCLRG
jgi:hypothetical protein